MSQKRVNKLSIEIGCGVNSYSMKRLNQIYFDSFLSNVMSRNNKIKSGQNFNLTIRFQPRKFFDFGLYGNNQYGSAIFNPTIDISSNNGINIQKHIGIFNVKTSAIGVGVIGSFFFNDLLKFEERKSKFLNKFELCSEFSGGIGFSRITFDLYWPSYSIANDYNYFSSNNFQSQLGLKCEYAFLKSMIISSLGIRFGYQYFKTKTLKDRIGKSWELGSGNNQLINLDFSGFYFGIFLKISK